MVIPKRRAGTRVIAVLVGHRHERPDREGLRRVEEADEPVVEAGALLRGRRAGERFEPAVHLQGVRGDRDRGLAARAEQFAYRDGDGGLADPGRPEDGYQLRRRAVAHASRASRRSSPASVVLVADSTRTCTSSPGAAAPWKFTVLLCRTRPLSLSGSVRDSPSTSTSISRPTNRCARSVPRRWTASTSRSIRARLTPCGTWSGYPAARVPRPGEK